ncbi:Initiation factor 2B-related like protein [Aduncisulcus paluster]|uniref:Translation initiation factor eIF2B subunit beta n=1 Tax=Aduncisulcus paluster TaxID=2918883 RepID=A0ABQ5K2Z3_9EUKA|nr:Initiation factor 2B-related like protein [Aduncisulcus paluster]
MIDLAALMTLTGDKREEIDGKFEEILVTLRKSNLSPIRAIEIIIIFFTDTIDICSRATVGELMDLIRNFIHRIIVACPTLYVVFNIGHLFFDYITSVVEYDCSLSPNAPRFKAFLKKQRSTIRTEMESIPIEAISMLNTTHDTILTIGYSSLVKRMLLKTKDDKTRTIDVIIAERAPFYDGRRMASELSASGVSVTLIPDCCIANVIKRVTKIFLEPVCVLMDGSILTYAGADLVATIGHTYKIPIIVLSPHILFTNSPSIKVSHLTAPPSFVTIKRDESLEKLTRDSYVDVLVPKYTIIKHKFISTIVVGGYGKLSPSQVFIVTPK